MVWELESENNNSTSLKSTVIESDFFKIIGYSTCWEDISILREALSIKPGDKILSITSAGDNTLALLLDDPEQIISLDFNQNQNNLLELKMAGFKVLTHEELLAFLGVLSFSNRFDLYRKVTSNISRSCREYWDEKKKDINTGIIFIGRQDKYFFLFGQILKRLLGKSRVLGLLQCLSIQEQKEYFEDNWDTKRWRYLFNFFFGKRIMSIVMAKEHFRYVHEENWGSIFRDRFENIALNYPVNDNYFLFWVLTGNYQFPNALPPYLREENYATIRDRIHKITIVTDEFEHFITSTQESEINKFNLSNIFDWVSDEQFVELMKHIVRVGKNNARFAYWNLLRKHILHEKTTKDVSSKTKISAKLLKDDRAFVYTNFEIGEINKQ